MPAPTNARAEARERFYRAALWRAADPECSNALAEFEDAYEGLRAFGKKALAERLVPTPTPGDLAEGERP